MSAAEAIEENLLGVLASSFSGDDGAANDVEDFESESAQYEFDADFQMKIATLAVRDSVFARKVQGLISPDYFEDGSVAMMVSLSQEYWEKYRCLPSNVAMKEILADALRSGRIRKDMKDDIIATFKKMLKGSISDRDFVADKVAEFARHQAIYRAMMKATDLMAKKQLDKIADMIKQASSVGVGNADLTYDYFEKIEERSLLRKERAAGILPPQGITTGLKKIDKLLFYRGWGRKALSMLMGGAKAGKSTGLLFFAKNAALAGHNVLYITLEMDEYIASSRIDACISETEMKELENNIGAVREAVEKANNAACGRLRIAQMPGYSLTPAILRRIIDSHADEGIRFDLIVLDYIDLMAPDYRSGSEIADSRNLYVGVRAIAQEEDLAILSATQTNREGFKSVVAKAEHAADDFNKIRIADITITINATDEERDKGEARLYFASSRNEQGGITVQIKQDIARMIFIKSVIGMV